MFEVIIDKLISPCYVLSEHIPRAGCERIQKAGAVVNEYFAKSVISDG